MIKIVCLVLLSLIVAYVLWLRACKLKKIISEPGLVIKVEEIFIDEKKSFFGILTPATGDIPNRAEEYEHTVLIRGEKLIVRKKQCIARGTKVTVYFSKGLFFKKVKEIKPLKCY